ncbi:MAG: alpha/beta fold hydrolase [Ideonella sp.]|nr:alpha/beta fold hydrolase [Ideonella sp.]MCC7456583.1 alpha/beta fold hydrolase [Nitrospira sp.]
MSRWLPRAIGLLLMVSALALALSRAPDRSVESLVARWAPPPSQFIDLHGQLVHLRDEGPRDDALPLVLLHGTAASLHTWEGWAAVLRAQHRVISFDLPGFGLTGPFAGRYASWSYRGDDLARFVIELLDTLKVQRFAIGGNSLGGEVAWRVAALAPDRVQRLVLVDAAGYALQPESVPLGFRLAQVPLANRLVEWLLPRGLVEDSVRNVYGNPARVTPALVDRYFELQLREGNRHALVQRFQAQALDQQSVDDAIARIRALKLPTLILWGGRDRLIPPQFAQRFAHDIAGSRRVVFDALGHVPQEEDPAATTAALQAFWHEAR